MNTAEIGWASVQHIVIERVKELFPGLVWENEIPEMDSYLTNNEYGFVVTEAFELPISQRGCDGSVIRATMTIHIYERSDCGRPGTMKALTGIIDEHLAKYLPGKYPTLNIDEYTFQSATPLPRFSKSYRSRALSLLVDYKDC